MWGRIVPVDASLKSRYGQGMSITAIVQDDTIKLPDGVHVPDGTEVNIEVPARPTQAQLEAWRRKAATVKLSGLTTDEIMRLTRGED
jgi:hypothetical protein